MPETRASRFAFACLLALIWNGLRMFNMKPSLAAIAGRLSHHESEQRRIETLSMVAGLNTSRPTVAALTLEHQIPSHLCSAMHSDLSSPILGNASAAAAQLCLGNVSIADALIQHDAVPKLWHIVDGASEDNLDAPAMAVLALSCLSKRKAAAAQLVDSKRAERLTRLLQTGAALRHSDTVLGVGLLATTLGTKKSTKEAWLKHALEDTFLLHVLLQVIVTNDESLPVPETVYALATLAADAAAAEHVVAADIVRHLVLRMKAQPGRFAGPVVRLLSALAQSGPGRDHVISVALRTLAEIAWMPGSHAEKQHAATALETVAAALDPEFRPRAQLPRGETGQRASDALAALIGSSDKSARLSAASATQSVIATSGRATVQACAKAGFLSGLKLMLAADADSEQNALAAELLAGLMADPAAQTTFLREHDGAALLVGVLARAGAPGQAHVERRRQAVADAVSALGSRPEGAQAVVAAGIVQHLVKLFMDASTDECIAAGTALRALCDAHRPLIQQLAAMDELVDFVKELSMHSQHEQVYEVALGLLSRLALDKAARRKLHSQAGIQRLMKAALVEEPRPALEALVVLAQSKRAAKAMKAEGIHRLLNFADKAPPHIKPYLATLQDVLGGSQSSEL